MTQAIFHLLRRLRQAIIKRFVALLTKPLKNYAVRFPNNLEALKSQIRKGDVLLVEGSQRISEVVKYLTQSSWSHSAIYIGDELIRGNHPLAEQARTAFGDDARFLLVEALVEEGVVLSPLSKYVEYNIRLCRPYNLQPQDCQVILDDVIGQLGYTYDLQNIFDLGRYFLPVSLVPRRFRRRALHFGSGLPTQVICSSMIASAFGKARFPILPHVDSTPDAQATHPSFYRRFFAKEQDTRGRPVFRRRHPTLITPRDFDLSPYFHAIKFNIIGSQRLDYRNIIWAEDSTADVAPAHTAAPPASAQPDFAASPVPSAPSVQGRAS